MTGAQPIEVRSLHKIFGANPGAHVAAVQAGLSKAELGSRHGHIPGLRDINMSMPAGRIQVVMGLSGSGKSTLIRHINRLIEPTSGQVLVNGQDVLRLSAPGLRDFRRTHTAMVFQKFGLLPHRTVIDNVTFGLEARGLDPGTARKAGPRRLDRVGLSGFETRCPKELSGGMQQRVGPARALASDAPILLMDEACSALDPLIRTDMQTMLLDLQAELKKTIVFITHDLGEALRLGDGIVILRDGSIVQQGDSQDILLRPAVDYIQRFVKDVNRGRYIRVDAVMDNAAGRDGRSLPRLVSGTVIESAIKTLSDAGSETGHVTDAEDHVLGQVTQRQLMDAL